MRSPRRSSGATCGTTRSAWTLAVIRASSYDTLRPQGEVLCFRASPASVSRFGRGLPRPKREAVRRRPERRERDLVIQLRHQQPGLQWVRQAALRPPTRGRYDYYRPNEFARRLDRSRGPRVGHQGRRRGRRNSRSCGARRKRSGATDQWLSSSMAWGQPISTALAPSTCMTCCLVSAVSAYRYFIVISLAAAPSQGPNSASSSSGPATTTSSPIPLRGPPMVSRSNLFTAPPFLPRATPSTADCTMLARARVLVSDRPVGTATG